MRIVIAEIIDLRVPPISGEKNKKNRYLVPFGGVKTMQAQRHGAHSPRNNAIIGAFCVSVFSSEVYMSSTLLFDVSKLLCETKARLHTGLPLTTGSSLVRGCGTVEVRTSRKERLDPQRCTW